jgi:hypothetical protein
LVSSTGPQAQAPAGKLRLPIDDPRMPEPLPGLATSKWSRIANVHRST